MRAFTGTNLDPNSHFSAARSELDSLPTNTNHVNNKRAGRLWRSRLQNDNSRRMGVLIEQLRTRTSPSAPVGRVVVTESRSCRNKSCHQLTRLACRRIHSTSRQFTDLKAQRVGLGYFSRVIKRTRAPAIRSANQVSHWVAEYPRLSPAELQVGPERASNCSSFPKHPQSLRILNLGCLFPQFTKLHYQQTRLTDSSCCQPDT